MNRQPRELDDELREDSEECHCTPSWKYTEDRLFANMWVYILADYLQIDELQGMAASRFAELIEHTEVCMHAVKELCILVYENSPEEAPHLRSILSELVCERGEHYRSKKWFMDAITQIPDLFRDVMGLYIDQHRAAQEKITQLEQDHWAAKEKSDDRIERWRSRMMDKVNGAGRCYKCQRECNIRLTVSTENWSRRICKCGGEY